MVDFLDSDFVKHVLVVILVATGLAHSDTTCITPVIQQGGMQLVVTTASPALLTDTERIKRRILGSAKNKTKLEDSCYVQKVHNMVATVHAKLKELKNNNITKPIEWTARIPLPFQVQEEIYDIDCIGDQATGERLLIYDLIAVNQQKYAEKQVLEVNFAPQTA